MFIAQTSCLWFNESYICLFPLLIVSWKLFLLGSWWLDWICIPTVSKILNKMILQQKERDRYFEFTKVGFWFVETNWFQRSNHESHLKSLFLGKTPVVNCFFFRFLYSYLYELLWWVINTLICFDKNWLITTTQNTWCIEYFTSYAAYMKLTWSS